MREIHARDHRTEEELKQWVQKFLNDSENRYVFGCNDWGKSVHKQIGVTGFVDDKTSLAEFQGRPVVRSNQVPRGAMVLSSVVGKPLTVRNQLFKKGISSLDYYSFLRLCPIPVLDIGYVRGSKEELEQNSYFYDRFIDRLQDDESRESCRRILNFRAHLNLNEMVVFENREELQYFEKFLLLERTSVFLDVGAFDGLTTSIFLERTGRDAVAHVFEPSPQARSRARAKLNSFQNVFLYDVALGAKHGRTYLREAGSASAISESGEVPIEIQSLDSFSITKADFIKVDIEGSELDFLEGAEDTILRLQPQVAIAAYHSADHIRRISSRILGLMPEARVYCRHYTEGFAETVLFFIPKRFW